MLRRVELHYAQQSPCYLPVYEVECVCRSACSALLSDDEGALVRRWKNAPGWFHPRPLGKRVWCGRRELNPHGLAACGFSYHFGFHRPASGGVVGWTIPSPFPTRVLGAS